MTNNQAGERLINCLLADPRKFDDEGRGYELLQEYFAGLPVETLRPLLRSDDVFVLRSAAFIASELGAQARCLIDDVIPLLCSTDQHVVWYAMEALTICAEGEHTDKFVYVIRMLESDNDYLRRLAMRLIANADISQLEGALRSLSLLKLSNNEHEEGLRLLVKGESVEPGVGVSMVRSSNPLLRRYGAIAAKRLKNSVPMLMAEVYSSDDNDLRKFE